MTLEEYKKLLVKDYESTGKELSVITSNGAKYVDAAFMSWVSEILLRATERVDKLNVEITHALEQIPIEKATNELLDTPTVFSNPNVMEKPKSKKDLFFGVDA